MPSVQVHEKTNNYSASQSSDGEDIIAKRKNMYSGTSPEMKPGTEAPSKTENISVGQRQNEMAELRAFSKKNREVLAAKKVLSEKKELRLQDSEPRPQELPMKSRRAKQIADLKSFSTKMSKTQSPSQSLLSDTLDSSVVDEINDHDAPAMAMDKEEFDLFVKELRQRAGISPEDPEASQNRRADTHSRVRPRSSAAAKNKEALSKGAKNGTANVTGTRPRVGQTVTTSHTKNSFSKERQQTREGKTVKRLTTNTTHLSSLAYAKSSHVTAAPCTIAATIAVAPKVYKGSRGGSVSEAAFNKLFSMYEPAGKTGSKALKPTMEVITST